MREIGRRGEKRLETPVGLEVCEVAANNHTGLNRLLRYAPGRRGWKAKEGGAYVVLTFLPKCLVKRKRQRKKKYIYIRETKF